jgi:hypothetical protein
MAVTATNRKPTLQTTLNGVEGDPGRLASAMQQAKLGTMLRPIKLTIAGLTAAATFALDTGPAACLAQGAPGTVGIVGDLPEGYIASAALLPKANVIKSLRITASGTGGSVGSYVVVDSGGTPAVPPVGGVGVATISDDGKTITFPNTVTGFVVAYLPAAATDLATSLPSAP